MNSSHDLNHGDTFQHFTPGTKLFGRYTLRQLLGNGRKGDVWRAHDENLDLDVALKILLNYPRFTELEAQAGQLMNLSHHAIIRFYDIAGDAQRGGFVMEFFESRPLSALLAERDGRPFEVSEIRRWVKDLFSALHYAHEKLGVLHRDIRLANLLVNPGQVMKVSEFGLAPTQTGADDADFQYLPALSPQVLVGEEYTVQDDLYAAAAAVYELLTGKPIFPGGNMQLQIQRKIPPTIAARRAEFQIKGDAIPKDWEEWIARCLEKERAARPASAREILDILDAGSSTTTTRGTSTSLRVTAVGAAVGTAMGSLREKDFSWAGPLMKAAAALAFLGGAVWWFWLKPVEGELADRRSVIGELESLEARSQEEISGLKKAGNDLTSLHSSKDTAEKTARRWQQFVEDYEADPLMFTNEDDAMLRDARRKQRNWEDEAEGFEKVIARIKEDTAEQIKQLDAAYARESDADAQHENKPMAEQMTVALDRHDAWNNFIKTYGGAGVPQTHDYQSVLAKAQEAMDRWQGIVERRKKEAEDWVALWEQDIQRVEASSYVMDRPKAERLAQVSSKLTQLGQEVVPLEAASRLTDFMGRLRQVEAKVKEEPDPVPVVPLDLGPFPKTLGGLFAHSPLADKSEAIQKAALKKIQNQLKEKGHYTKTIDGSPGPALETALKAWQEENKLAVTGHLDAATWPTMAIGIMAEADLLKELEAEAAMAAAAQKTSSGTSSRAKSKLSPRGINYAGKEPSRGYYSNLALGKVRLLKDTSGGKLKPEAAKDPQKVKDWKYHNNTWLDYCEWERRQ